MATRDYKRRAYVIACTLGYESVMPNLHELIYGAESEIQVDNILTLCRHMMSDTD